MTSLSLSFDGLGNETTSTPVTSEFQERLCAKILDFVKTEIQKEEVRNKLLGFMDPMVNHVSRGITPYLVLTMVIITLILVCQGYLVFKLWKVQNTLLEDR